MQASLEIPAALGDVALPLADSAQAEADEVLADLFTRWFRIGATNRLRPSDHKNNRIFHQLEQHAVWTVEPSALRATLDVESAQEEDARWALHWLEVAWAASWTTHLHETQFARPFPTLDITITIDPVSVLQRHAACPCRLCAYYRPRVAKWGVKRKGLAEVFRQIGEGQPVLAGAIFPMMGGARNLKAAGLPSAKKTEMISAERAIQWLALNPRRAFR